MRGLRYYLAVFRSDSSCAQIGSCVLRISEREILIELIQELEAGILRSVTKSTGTVEAIKRKSKRPKLQLTENILDWCESQKQLFLRVD